MKFNTLDDKNYSIHTTAPLKSPSSGAKHKAVSW